MKTFILPSDFTRVTSDVYGNPRYACHFLKLLTDEEKQRDWTSTSDIFGIDSQYKFAVKRSNLLGGRKYHNKKFGGGIVFQSYNIQDTCNAINNLLNQVTEKQK
jgi:hypothetical protein